VHKNNIIISTVRTYLRNIVCIDHDNKFIVSTAFSIFPMSKSNTLLGTTNSFLPE